jgi:hypothetical protein
MSAEDTLLGMVVRLIRRPLAKAVAKGRTTVSLPVDQIAALLDHVDELTGKNGPPSRAEFDALAGEVSTLRERMDARDHEVGPMDRLGSDVGEHGDGTPLGAFALEALPGWLVDVPFVGRWVATNGDMQAIASTRQHVVEAALMCTAECPVVTMDANGRLVCECDEDDGETHDQNCPLSRGNLASYTYSVERGHA